MAFKLKKSSVVLFQGDSSTNENKYIKLLEKESINAKNIPVLSFNFINSDKLHKCLHNAECYSGIIFTSARAVYAISSSLISSRDLCLEQWKKKVNFSIGKATGDTAFSVLNLTTYGTNSGNSEDLSQFIIEKCRHCDKPLLFPCSNIRKDTIPDILSANGISVEELICYETVPNKDFEYLWKTLVTEEGLPEILIFFSPSGVQACIDAVRNTYSGFELPKFIAIGPSTGKALHEANIHYNVAEKPTPESIVHIVKDLLNNS